MTNPTSAGIRKLKYVNGSLGSVRSDESQVEWNQKKSSLLFDIQLCQLCFLGVLVYILATLSINLPVALYAMYLVGMYVFIIRETYRARMVAADFQYHDKQPSLSWKTFFKVIRRNPVVLFPAWSIFK